MEDIVDEQSNHPISSSSSSLIAAGIETDKEDLQPHSLAFFQSNQKTLRVGTCEGEGVYLLVKHPFDKEVQKRFRLGDCDEDATQTRCQILLDGGGESNFIILVGYRTIQKKQSLRIWRYYDDATSDNQVQQLNFTFSDPSKTAVSITGFATAILDSPQNRLLIATGLGKGVAKLWELNLNSLQLSLVREYKARDACICAMLITEETKAEADGCPVIQRKFLAGSNFQEDPYVQEWEIVLDPTMIIKVKPRGLSRKQIRNEIIPVYTRFAQDLYHPNVKREVWEYIQKHTEWMEVFPTIALDPFAYEGETDCLGKPHGKGKKQLVGEGMVFVGQWLNGQAVHGEITGKHNYLYQGEVCGENPIKHGYGEERRTCGGGEIEIYRGGFKDGQRHGLGILRWENTNALKHKFHGQRDVGFFQQNKSHGLCLHEWSVDSPELPFAKGKEVEVKRLGAIRCIQMRINGKYFDEFYFHRADGKPWKSSDKLLLNVIEDSEGPESFAIASKDSRVCGRSDRPECWACLAEHEGNQMYVCVSCGMRVHQSCAWPPQFFAFPGSHLFGLTNSWICPLCSEQIVSKSQRIIAYDRHGEEIILEDASDVLSVLPAVIPDASDKVAENVVSGHPASHYRLKLFAM
jgi:hypothetical protein